MKKSKSLVVTSLLFSTMILNPSVIHGVIVQADAVNQEHVAETNETKTKMITFHLSVKDINGKIEIKDYQVKAQLDQKTVAVAEINEALHGFYKLAEKDENKTYNIDFEKNEIKDVLNAVDSFVPETTKTLSVQYLDSTNNGRKFAKATMVVDKNTKEVAGETVPLPRGYEISGRRMIKIRNEHTLLVHIKPINFYGGHEVSKSDVTVKYVNDKNASDKIADGVIKDVRDDATSVDQKLVTVPKGYKLVKNQKFAVSYGKVTVHVIPENTKEIAIKYLDSTNNQNKIKDGTMIVDKNAKKVAGETVPMPKGYEFSGRRMIDIFNGKIRVHVKPVNFYGGHEVSKSDVTVKYVNDKNSKDKIAYGVIKDVRDDATSVDSKLVVVPEGYKLVEGQKFAVSYGKVTVHVVPVVESTKEITIKYLDSTNNQNKIKNGKMTVAKDAKKVAGETIPMPEGYEFSGRRMVVIQKDFILVSVKPIKSSSNHEVSKSDVTVKYINDKNANDKIANGVIKDVRDDATSVDSKLVVAPKGYKLVEGQKFTVSYGKVKVHVVPNETTSTQTLKPSKPSSNNHSSATQASFKMSVHFVDHKSGDKVHSTELVSKEGQQHEVAVPKNYVLASGETNKISASKKKTTVSIKVVKKAVEGVVTEHKATLSVVSNAPLYSTEGKVVNDRALAKGSNWFTDKTLVLDGTTYYRVSTNEWVKASDVYEFTTVNKTIQTSAKTAKSLYDTKGNVISDRALAAGSSWFADRKATINGKQMYRVATNEWVLASDLA